MNIEEDYVSFETAKLLKERGFDEQTVKCYNLKHELCKCQCNPGETINSTPNYLIAAPTLQMACKWLREVHNTFICINMVGNGDDSYVLFTYNVYQNKNYKLMFGSNIPKYNSYEEAVEAAIKYCLENLI